MPPFPIPQYLPLILFCVHVYDFKFGGIEFQISDFHFNFQFILPETEILVKIAGSFSCSQFCLMDSGILTGLDQRKSRSVATRCSHYVEGRVLRYFGSRVVAPILLKRRN